MGAPASIWRLLRAGRTLARYDALLTPQQWAGLPWFARSAIRIARFGATTPRGTGTDRLTLALSELGPSYIKLGQFLATRPDIVGAARSTELRALQDRLPPFSLTEAKAEVRAMLSADADTLFTEFSEPVAAASIAQVHKARTVDGAVVAVKILRPSIEQRFAADLESFFLAARAFERVSAEGRRLRPVAAVETLADSVRLELDLRMEAAAIAEMARNVAEDKDFRVPGVVWPLTARRVLTVEWIDGTALSDVAGLQARGLDLDALADTAIRSFLRHAIRDGFFHADMHQGNLFADEAGRLAAVDFGIMGRLNEEERRFLAEILYGFITRDYRRVADVHFEAGYVPADRDPATFAQALRAIGEPIMDKAAADISMARLLTQLFEVTGQFGMRTQPRLILLQKTMVVIEGVARSLNPRFNMWTASEPVLRDWLERKLGPAGQLEGSAAALGRLVTTLPGMLGEAQKATHMLAGMAQSGGLRLDRETTEALALAQSRQSRASRYAIVVGAAALVLIALAMLF